MWFLLRSYQFCSSLWSSGSPEHLFFKGRSRDLKIKMHTLYLWQGRVSVGSAEEHMSDVCGPWCQTSQSECISACGRREEGVVTGYGDGSNGISLWLTQTHKHTMLAAWVAVPGVLIFLQLDPHPMASTDASKPPSRKQLHVSLKGHLLCKPPYKPQLNVYYFHC